MKRFRVFTLAALLFVFTAAGAAAPAPAPTAANPFDFMGMMRGMQFGPLALLRHPDVRKEMRLSKAQEGDLKKLQKEYEDALKAITREAQGGGDTTKMLELAKQTEALETAFGRRALELLDEAQRKRLSEIRVQALGFRALLDPEIATALAITGEQKTGLSVLDREFMQGMAKVMRSGRTMKRDKAALLKEYKAKAAEILSAEQNTRFAAMEGAPFKGAGDIGF